MVSALIRISFLSVWCSSERPHNSAEVGSSQDPLNIGSNLPSEGNCPWSHAEKCCDATRNINSIVLFSHLLRKCSIICNKTVPDFWFWWKTALEDRSLSFFSSSSSSSSVSLLQLRPWCQAEKDHRFKEKKAWRMFTWQEAERRAEEGALCQV